MDAIHELKSKRSGSIGESNDNVTVSIKNLPLSRTQGLFVFFFVSPASSEIKKYKAKTNQPVNLRHCPPENPFVV